jgi:hypothetical protein
MAARKGATVDNPRLSRDLVMCRAFRHAWDADAPDIRFRNKSAQQQAARCVRCGTKRFQWLSWEGKAIACWYEYSENYDSLRGLTPSQAKIWIIDHDKSATRKRVTAAALA